jgi:hypothetical protein
VGLVVVELARPEPLLEVRLLRGPPFAAAIAMAVLGQFAFGAFLFVVAQDLQHAHGLSALGAGLCMLPAGCAIVVLSPVVGRVVAVRSWRLGRRSCSRAASRAC